jgi:hypothetical protein
MIWIRVIAVLVALLLLSNLFRGYSEDIAACNRLSTAERSASVMLAVVHELVNVYLFPSLRPRLS